MTVNFTRTDYPGGINARSIAVGDWNKDGNPDFAVANNAAGTVSVLLGHGDGSFQAPVSYPVSYVAGSPAAAVVAGDLNGDGKLDLAVGGGGASGDPLAVFVLLGNGDGTFQSPVWYA